MRHTLLATCLLALFLFFPGQLKALNPPPANDSAWGAADLGFLPLPQPCPAGGGGDTALIFGSTTWASYNTFDFSPVHCFPNGSPDVWYRFIASGSLLEVEAIGSNGLDTFFVKLFDSQGSCFSLIPLTCETSNFGVLSATFQTPEMGGEYYLQIGGNDYNVVGDFVMTLRQYNNCNECVRNATVEMDPAPWFGRYGTSETVKMCVTVDRWDYIGSADIHGIVPHFGPEWDVATLTPLNAPLPQSTTNTTAWQWFTNIPTPDGISSGFFFDYDLDGNPSNNVGDDGNILSSWTGCWSIATMPNCNSFDLSVDVHIYCDVQTGTGSPNFACSPAPPVRMEIAGWCCPSPQVIVLNSTNCTTNGGMVVSGVGNAGDIYNYTVYDTGYTVVGSAQNVTGGFTFSNLPPGFYNVEVYNQTSTCISYSTVEIRSALQVDLVQTAVSCGPGNATAIALANGNAPYTYTYVSPTGISQNDSLAFNVPDGWLVVKVSDNAGCTEFDSIWVISMPAPDASFSYSATSYCSTVDTVFVGTPPTSPGVFMLVSPQSVGINVDPQNGNIYLAGSTVVPPYWVVVKYTAGASNCTASELDSVYIIPQPLAPVVSGPTFLSYCIGGPSPVLNVTVPFTEIATWYDNQTTQTTFGNTLVTPLDASSAPGTYYYGVISYSLANGNCYSPPVIFTVNAIASPQLFTSSDTSVCRNEVVTMNASGCPSCGYTWNPPPTAGPGNTPVTATSPSASTTYTVTAVDSASGCVSNASVTVSIDQSGACFFHVYSGLTPNGDGHNDAWVIDGIDSLPGVRVTIFNRWGYEVWDGHDYDNRSVVFSGQANNGNTLPDGTYYYIIVSGDVHLKGWIELSH